MNLSIIKKSPSDVLVKDLIKGLKQQGVADEDIIASMTKAGIPDEMARSMILRVTEELEVEGVSTSKSVARTEIDSSLFEWGKDFEAKIDEKLDSFSENLDVLKAELNQGRTDQERCLKELESIKSDVKDLSSSVKSFEVLAKEILKALKK
jgi:archaellum component FlaC